MLKFIYIVFPFLENRKIAGRVIIGLFVVGLLAVVAGLLHVFTPLELVTNGATRESADTKETVQFIIGFAVWTAIWAVVYYIYKRNLNRDQ